MKFSNLSIAAAVSAAAATEDCKYALEIVQLQDGSASFQSDLTEMQGVAPELFNQLAANYPGMKFGLSSFIDKPIPVRGYGPYGGYQHAGIYYDYCYKQHLPMTTDAQQYSTAISQFTVGSGFDFQENQLEAILRCALDPITGFSPPEVQYDAQGRPIVRIVILVTDASPHEVGDAAGATTNFWDWPRTYAADGSSSGGFGSDSFSETSVCSGAITDLDSYEQITPYFHKYDQDPTSLTDDDKKAYAKLLAKVGPYPFPAPVAHPGDASLPCETVEYPSAAQVGAVLQQTKVVPIILIAPLDPSSSSILTKQCDSHKISYTDAKDCITKLYTEYLTTFGVGGAIGSLDDGASNIVEAIIAAVGQVTDEICLSTTTTLPPLSSTTTSSTLAPTTSTTPVALTTSTTPVAPTTSTTPVAPTTSTTPVAPTSSTTPAVAPTTSTTPVAPTSSTIPVVGPTVAPIIPTIAPTAAPVNPTGAAGGSTTASSSTENTKTGGSSGGGIPVGPIAGACAGGIAAIGAGVLLYSKFGAGILGKKPSPDLDAIQQVEVPESPLEREAMEEVTMEMFQ